MHALKHESINAIILRDRGVINIKLKESFLKNIFIKLELFLNNSLEIQIFSLNLSELLQKLIRFWGLKLRIRRKLRREKTFSNIVCSFLLLKKNHFVWNNKIDLIVYEIAAPLRSNSIFQFKTQACYVLPIFTL